MIKQTMGIYIHIPFCVKKCEYCDFLSMTGSDELIENYIKALIKEISNYGGTRYVVSTIFFGGGTPSIIEAKHIVSIINTLKETFSVSDKAEITLEINPGTLTQDKIKVYLSAGINRLSMGLQSANNRELALLGRIHTYEEFQAGYEIAREAGIENINVDLMSGLPEQSVASWESTLRKVLHLEPEHISAYGLIIEEKTPFFEKYEKDEIARQEGEKTEYLPEEKAEREMYYVTEKVLKEYGYNRYEISNYAKKGYRCQHNVGYWERKDYLGFGLGASSLMEQVRFTNGKDISLYIEGKGLLQNIEVLSRKEQMEEFMFLGLRMIDGISIEDFETEFACSYESIFGSVTKALIEKGLIGQAEKNIYLTNEGIDVSNYVLAEFLL
jgi:putative oxygen-independent coproporphyrinogen III oxidase